MGSRCQSPTRDLAVGCLDDLGGFPNCLVPDSGAGKGSSGGVEPGGDRSRTADLRRHYSRHRPHRARHQRQPDHDELVVMPLDVLVEYRRPSASCSNRWAAAYTRSIRTMVIRFPSTSYSTR